MTEGVKKYRSTPKGKRSIRKAKVRYRSSYWGRYSELLEAARKRGFRVKLTEEEHRHLLALPCHWCGGHLDKTGYGLDRLHNNKEYTRENLVPCCKRCNSMKSDLSVEEFLGHIAKIALRRRA